MNIFKKYKTKFFFVGAYLLALIITACFEVLYSKFCFWGIGSKGQCFLIDTSGPFIYRFGFIPMYFFPIVFLLISNYFFKWLKNEKLIKFKDWMLVGILILSIPVTYIFVSKPVYVLNETLYGYFEKDFAVDCCKGELDYNGKKIIETRKDSRFCVKRRKRVNDWQWQCVYPM